MLAVARQGDGQAGTLKHLRNTSPPANACGRTKARNPVLMAILMACWRWLTAPAEGVASPPVRAPRALHATVLVASRGSRSGTPSLAPLHAPLPRLPS